jgi:lipoprotein NlpD
MALLIISITGCESNPPAPVIDRLPQSSKPKPPAVTKQTDAKATKKDWRPDNHIVKKGDTLFSIGLEYGIDYKEIAAANDIVAPYPIQIGQKLNLSSFKVKPVTDTNQPEDGVVITPMKTEPAVAANQTTDTKAIPSAVTPTLSEPKAIREAYSLEAFNRSIVTKSIETKPIATKPTDAQATQSNSVDTKPTDTKIADDESMSWLWPAQGKMLAGFNEGSNKGIDIGGTIGQSITAASGGKVIYSGSDLRGYGKLVIIKHNKTYLSVYAHNSKIIVKEGQIVAANQKIAEMGNTDSNAVKLHFEIRRLGKSVDPAKYLN